MKYSSYKEEFVLICKLLVQAAEGDQNKTAQFYNLINGDNKWIVDLVLAYYLIFVVGKISNYDYDRSLSCLFVVVY